MFLINNFIFFLVSHLCPPIVDHSAENDINLLDIHFVITQAWVASNTQTCGFSWNCQACISECANCSFILDQVYIISKRVATQR